MDDLPEITPEVVQAMEVVRASGLANMYDQQAVKLAADLLDQNDLWDYLDDLDHYPRHVGAQQYIKLMYELTKRREVRND